MGNPATRITLLDGGLGTTIADLGCELDKNLWGTELLQTNPKVLRDIVTGWLNAGAELHSTSTYQLTRPVLERQLQLDQATAERVMRSAITLVKQTIDSHAPVRPSRRHPGVVLCFGPYGATIPGGHEYTGVYPPPYGPDPLRVSTAAPNLGPEPPSNAWPASPRGREMERQAALALKEWHLARLRIYAADPAIWDTVEWVAFETVPLVSEMAAIRAAMYELQQELVRHADPPADGASLGANGKKFWISSAYPNGLHPHLDAQGRHLSVKGFVHAALSPEEGRAVPAGIGLNCTNPNYLESLASQFTEAVRSHSKGPEAERPQLVLYPDGGAVYDGDSRTWTERTYGAGDWAAHVGRLAQRAATEKDEAGQYVWGGVVVGGCCKSGFAEIAALRRFLDSPDNEEGA